MDVEAVRAFRDRLRALLIGEAVALGRDGHGAPRTGRVRALARAPGRSGGVLAIIAGASADGTWERLKVCPRRGLPLGVLRLLAQPLAHLVLDERLREPGEGPGLPGASSPKAGA